MEELKDCGPLVQVPLQVGTMSCLRFSSETTFCYHKLYYLCCYYVILPPQGLTAGVSTSYMDQPQGGVLLLLALNVFYVAMVIVVVSLGVEEHRGRDKNQWMLTQQLHHLDLFWLNSGSDCEVIFDPNTCSVYATLSMNLHSESKYNRIESGSDINIMYYTS